MKKWDGKSEDAQQLVGLIKSGEYDRYNKPSEFIKAHQFLHGYNPASVRTFANRIRNSMGAAVAELGGQSFLNSGQDGECWGE